MTTRPRLTLARLDELQLDSDDQITAHLATTPKVEAVLQHLRAGVSLHRVIAIGRYRRSWTPAEARWIKAHYIDHAPLEGEWRPSVSNPRPTRGVHLPTVNITARQAGILDGLCRGLDADAIAAEVGLIRNTVQHHIRGIVQALDAEDSAHAAIMARERHVCLLVRGPRGRRPASASRAAISSIPQQDQAAVS